MKLVIEIPQAKYNTLKNDRTDYKGNIGVIYKAIQNGTKLPKCKDCKYFEYDSVAKVDGIPLIVAHEICLRWGN